MVYSVRTLEGKTRIFADDGTSIDILKSGNDIEIDLEFYLGNGEGFLVSPDVARHMANAMLRLCDNEEILT